MSHSENSEQCLGSDSELLGDFINMLVLSAKSLDFNEKFKNKTGRRVEIIPKKY